MTNESKLFKALEEIRDGLHWHKEHGNGLTVQQATIYTIANSALASFKGQPDEEDGVSLIAKERKRQIEKEGWDNAHDDGHIHGELAAAGAAYALWNWSRTDAKRLWPFEKEGLKAVDGEPEYYSEKKHRLAKAGALMAAEIDRLERKRLSEITPKTGIL